MERQDYDLGYLLKYENVAWYDGDVVRITDRRKYPNEVTQVICKSWQEVAKAIADMVTQSAGPYTATYMAMALAAKDLKGKRKEEVKKGLDEAAIGLQNARPTTKSRIKIITDNCLREVEKNIDSQNLDEIIFNLGVESLNRRYFIMDQVGKNLVSLMPRASTVLTQCYGETIVGMMIRNANEMGKKIKMVCAETRPYFQGSRLTASVAVDMGVDTTVITDNMVSFAIKDIGIDLFTSAADVITKEGVVVNKIGTYQIAILAKYHHIPYYVTGIPDQVKVKDIEIEYRDPKESKRAMGKVTAKEEVKGYYPAFDLTPSHLVSGVVTDKGIYTPYNLCDYHQGETPLFY